MAKLVIQDHIISEIYEYINSNSTDIPEYVKFAYVADRYSKIKANFHNLKQNVLDALILMDPDEPNIKKAE